MNKIITAALFGAFLTSCVAHAHTPTPHASAHAQVKVKAWVWTPGFFHVNGVYVHGSWHVAIIDRHLLSRSPRQHIRWVKGRKKPAATQQRPHRKRHRKRHNHRRTHRH
jgi:hypothetical protein